MTRQYQRNVTVVVGGQYGSEGKGAALAAIASKYDILVRTGACNAAHTTYYDGKPTAWHQIPCTPYHAPKAKLVLGAGAQIDLKYLRREIQWLKDNDAWLDKDWGKPRLYIDGNATLIEDVDVDAENGWSKICGPQWYTPTACEIHNSDQNPDGVPKTKNACEGCHLYPIESMHKAVGSTTHGSGYNLMRKLARISATGESAGMLRNAQGHKVPRVKLASEVPELAPYITDTVVMLNQANDDGVQILLEGTQGSGLSMHFGPWPTTTSRDTNASNWAMEAGISPMIVREVGMVVRTYPIRVAGASGPMGGRELTWSEVTRRAYGLSHMSEEALDEWLLKNNKKMFREITTATKRMRRVAEFSVDNFRRAVQLNRPTFIMLTFVDYLCADDYGKTRWGDLSRISREWIERIERESGAFFNVLGTGPEVKHQIYRGG